METTPIKDTSKEDLSKLETSRSYMVVKSNDLIQKSRFQLSVQSQKIILYLISMIKHDDVDFIYQKFSVSEFCRICGIDYDNGKNYKNVKSAIKELADRSIWITLDNGTETLVRWINKVWINPNSGSIEIRFDDDMKPYLLQLKDNYTQYELLFTLAMRSQYSIRLYEILKSYVYRYPKITLDIIELKRILFAEHYERFPDFKRKVLEIAMREINELSDLTVSYEIIKQGRKYEKIEFNIKLKKNLNERLHTYKNIGNILNPEQISLYDRIYANTDTYSL